MKALLLILALISAALGFISFTASFQAPIREIEALVFFLIAAVLISGSAIVAAVSAVRADLKSNGAKLDRLGAALATPPELEAAPEPGNTEPAETYLVQLSDGVRGTFTHAQLESLLDRGIIDRRAFVLPAGASAWIRLSELANH